MSSIAEITEQREDFIRSNRLQRVAIGLGKILDNQPFTTDEIDTFTSFGDLFGQIDWGSKHYGKEHPELNAIATELRPLFYLALLEKRVTFNSEYSERIYQTLTSAGSQNELSFEELYQIQEVFQYMGHILLSELNASEGHI